MFPKRQSGPPALPPPVMATYGLSHWMGICYSTMIRTPTIFGSVSAIRDVNHISITLTGSAVAVAALTVSGSQTPLTAGDIVDFGSVVIKQPQTQTFTFSNAYSSTLTVNSVAVSGVGFSGPTGATFPLQIGPGQQPTFKVTFTPQSGTPYQGTLTVRHDVGYQYTPTPYQLVYEADFSSVTNVGQFRVLVPGMGGSLPFQINDGIAMDFARTYALGRSTRYSLPTRNRRGVGARQSTSGSCSG